jgi:small subunit ribosomal protein S23
MSSAVKSRAKNGRRLGPQPIIYLEDRVRERFYNDHPWETFQPRMLVEGRTLSDRRVPHADAIDLTAWGRNPCPEE